jgi:C4-dicarboxylate-specific signal transduction histidine kinase
VNNTTKIITLIEKLKSTENAEEQISILLQITEKYWLQNNYEQAQEYAKKATNLALSMNNNKRIAESHYLLGLSQCYLNNYDEALHNYFEAYKIRKKLGHNDSVSEILNNIGQIYIFLEDYEKALQFYLESWEMRPDYSRTSNNLALAYNSLDQLDKALEWATRAYRLTIEKPTLRDPQGTARSKAISLINLAEIHTKRGKYSEALHAAEEALAMATGKINDIYLVSLYTIGHVLTKTGRLEEARVKLESARDQALEHQNKDHLKSTYRFLAENAAARKDFEHAYYYANKHHQLDRSMFNTKMADRIALLKTQFETERAELKNLQMAERASRLASIGVMAAGITHEINQPLCAIKVTVDSIDYWTRKNGHTLPAPLEKGLDKISRGATRIDEIITHMRSFWTEEAPRPTTTIDANATLRKALTLLESQLHSHLVYLDLQLCDPAPRILCEEIHFEQIIINLIVNAMHSLDACDHSGKKILITSHSNPNNTRIIVQDNGTGLPEKHIDRIFDPFFSTKSEGKGMGLGLAIVKRYVDKYEGKIKAENCADGARFIMEFPALGEDNEDSGN